jgi:hypothetical protein
MSFVSIGIALGSAGLGLYAQNQAASRQDSQAAAGIRQQGLLQQQETQKSNQLIQNVADSNDTGAKQTLLGQFTQELQAKKANSTQNLNQVGAVSSAYTKGANAAASGIADYGNTTAGLLSSIDAPGLQRQGEAADLSRFGSQLGQVQQQSAADQFLNQMKLNSIKPNPWLTGISQAGQAYALASARGGGGGTLDPSSISQGTATLGYGATDGAGAVAGAAAPGFGGLYNYAPVYGAGL